VRSTVKKKLPPVTRGTPHELCEILRAGKPVVMNDPFFGRTRVTIKGDALAYEVLSK
jgi:hypothetical protein